MNQAERTIRQVGMWSASGTAIVGIVYVCVGALGVLFRPSGGTLLRQVDPYLAILEILIILAALVSDVALGRLERDGKRIAAHADGAA